MCTFISTQAQVLYTENFNGGTHTFTLNSTDVSSTSIGYNDWLVNNSYAGGTVIETCTGFNFPIPISATTSEPGGIIGSPNSNYLHICSDWGQAAMVLNANFQAADGSCAFGEGYFAKMTSDISTTGQTGVSFSFWWLCAGGTSSFGEVYYSTDGGASWNLQQGNMFGQSSWVQLTLINSLWDNQATLRFGFKFVNNITGSASDPSFSIDDISIFVPSANTITTGTITGSPFCAGSSLVVPYTITGTFTGGNVFTAQLSDAFGSFASPTNIGTLASTTAGSISCVIPGGTPSGTGYLVRVVSSTPVVTGSSSTAQTINPTVVPTIAISAVPSGTICAGTNVLFTASITNGGGAPAYQWQVNGVNVGTNSSTYSSTTLANGDFVSCVLTSNAACASPSTVVSNLITMVVANCAGIEDEEFAEVNVYPNPTSDLFTISINENMIGESQVTVLNMVGSVVYTISLNQSKTIISSESLGLSAGIYLIKVKYKELNRVVRLIVR